MNRDIALDRLEVNQPSRLDIEIPGQVDNPRLSVAVRCFDVSRAVSDVQLPVDRAQVKLPCDVHDADIAIRGAHLDLRFPGNGHFHIGAKTVVPGGQGFAIGFHDKGSSVSPAFQANLVRDFLRLRLFVLIDLLGKSNFDFTVASLGDCDIAIGVFDAKRHRRREGVGGFL